MKAKTETIRNLRQTITRMETGHLETSRTGNLNFTKCVVCGDVNTISDYANRQETRSSNAWFRARHEECGRKFQRTQKSEKAISRLDEARRNWQMSQPDYFFQEGEVERIYQDVV